MPGLSGLDLQSRLIAEGHCIPVIFVTAFPEERFRRVAMNAGAIAFLSKPLDENILIDCLERALSPSWYLFLIAVYLPRVPAVKTFPIVTTHLPR
jgi:FixJ family two-component response regulator